MGGSSPAGLRVGLLEGAGGVKASGVLSYLLVPGLILCMCAVNTVRYESALFYHRDQMHTYACRYHNVHITCEKTICDTTIAASTMCVFKADKSKIKHAL